ncbi:hypothetical protein RHGRI_009257 [Rhododendron griersonianum]|uniref:Uncharacterized protein n=1 Tax=Rhododendron griersonianum TaxID=479676 RepID=A0AAV6L5Y7_9ERIC|nr:hypothetical protein RHGRI_009257 [Rhododendron griersonianum]
MEEFRDLQACLEEVQMKLQARSCRIVNWWRNLSLIAILFCRMSPNLIGWGNLEHKGNPSPLQQQQQSQKLKTFQAALTATSARGKGNSVIPSDAYPAEMMSLLTALDDSASEFGLAGDTVFIGVPIK